MSMFMPEGDAQGAHLASFAPATPTTTSEDVALMTRVFAAAAQNANLIPEDFMSYLIDFISTTGLTIPIGQVFGYSSRAPFGGVVSSAGAVTRGLGFSAAKTGTGRYTITLDDALKIAPAVVVCLDGGVTGVIAVNTITTSTFLVLCDTVGGVAQDAGFTFVVQPLAA